MFELTLANWPQASRLLSENVSEVFMVFCLIHKLTIGFAVVGVINGVFFQETFKVVALDDVNMVRQKERAERMHTRKMLSLLKEADLSGDGLMDLEEFRTVMADEGIRCWLASMDINTEDIDALFFLLDTSGDGQVDATELTRGISRLRGNARSLDLNLLMRDLKAAGLPGKLHDVPVEPLVSSQSALR